MRVSTGAACALVDRELEIFDVAQSMERMREKLRLCLGDAAKQEFVGYQVRCVTCIT